MAERNITPRDFVERTHVFDYERVFHILQLQRSGIRGPAADELIAAFEDLLGRSREVYAGFAESVDGIRRAMSSLSSWCEAGRIRAENAGQESWASLFRSVDEYLVDLRVSLAGSNQPARELFALLGDYAERFVELPLQRLNMIEVADSAVQGDLVW